MPFLPPNQHVKALKAVTKINISKLNQRHTYTYNFLEVPHENVTVFEFSTE